MTCFEEVVWLRRGGSLGLGMARMIAGVGVGVRMKVIGPQTCSYKGRSLNVRQMKVDATPWRNVLWRCSAMN